MEYEFIAKIQCTETKKNPARTLLTVGIVALIVAMVAEFAINNYWSAVMLVPLVYLIAERSKMRGKHFTRDALARAVRDGDEIRFDLRQAETVNNTSCDVVYIFDANTIGPVLYRTDKNLLSIQAQGQKLCHWEGNVLKGEMVGGIELTVAPMDAARIENVLGRQISYQ